MGVAELWIIASALGVLYFVYLIGKSRGREEERKKKPPKSHPICPCRHVWGEHDKGGPCLAEVKRTYYGQYGGVKLGSQWVRCACTKYHGPTVVTDEFFSPGLHIDDD